jgi:hypothetical protein
VATVANMKQNLAFAFVYNGLGMPLAAGLLYPAFGMAAVADDRGAGDEPELGVGGWQRIEAPQRAMNPWLLMVTAGREE